MTDQEIVRAAAERIMGWRYWRFEENGPSRFDGSFPVFSQWNHSPDVATCFVHHAEDESDRWWNPLTSIADAWMLVEKLRDQGLNCVTGNNAHAKVQNFAAFVDAVWSLGKRINSVPEDGDVALRGWSISETARRAITIAALRAVGVDCAV